MRPCAGGWGVLGLPWGKSFQNLGAWEVGRAKTILHLGRGGNLAARSPRLAVRGVLEKLSSYSSKRRTVMSSFAYKRSTAGGNIIKDKKPITKKLVMLMTNIISIQSITRGKLAGLVKKAENVSTMNRIVIMRARSRGTR